MFAAPADLDPSTLAVALREHWVIDAVELAYLPVGFGGHHWLAGTADGGRWFVTVDDLPSRVRGEGDTLDTCFAHLSAAYTASCELAAGLDFVVGPQRARDGAVTHRLAAGYSLVVHAYLDDARTTGGDRAADARQILALLARLHAVPVGEGLSGAPREEFVVPNRTELLDDLPWLDGPYAARARLLVRTHAADVAVLVEYYEQVAARLAARPDRLVVTHGEPHGDNVLRTGAGLVLVDWDTTLVAPPERDLWMLADEIDGVPELYEQVSGTVVDRAAVGFYRLWFDLDEIGRYSRLFRGEHAADANTAVAWGGLQERLNPRGRWPQLFA